MSSKKELRQKEVSTFVKGRLERFMPSELADRFTDATTWEIWDEAFTHFSASPYNYEWRETAGDVKADSSLFDIIKKRLPHLTDSEQYATLLTYYHSETVFSEIGIKEKLLDVLNASPQILADEVAKAKIAEDLFEAFIGAIFEVGEAVGLERYGVGMGSKYVENYLIFIYNDIELDLALALGPYRNQLNEIMSTFRIPHQELIEINGINDLSYYYYIKRSALVLALENLGMDQEIIEKAEDPSILRERDLELSNAFRRKNRRNHNEFLLLAHVSSHSADDARMESARLALEFLASEFGITREVAEEFKGEITKKVDNEALNYLSQFYTDISYIQGEYGANTYYYIRGVRPDGRMVNIAELKTSSKTNYKLAREELTQKAYRIVKQQQAKREEARSQK